MVYTVYICHTEGSIKLREHKQRTSGAEVNLFITRTIHQLAFTRYAFNVSRSNAIDDLPDGGSCHYELSFTWSEIRIMEMNESYIS